MLNVLPLKTGTVADPAFERLLRGSLRQSLVPATVLGFVAGLLVLVVRLVGTSPPEAILFDGCMTACYGLCLAWRARHRPHGSG